MDTIMIIRDSVATCLKGMADSCLPSEKDAGISWQEVILSGLKYAFVLCIVYWVINNFFKWWTQYSMKKTQRTHEIEDRKWKQESILKDKLLSYLKERTFTDEKNDEGDMIRKYHQEGCTAYTEKLNEMITELHDQKEQKEEDAKETTSC